MTSVIKFSRFLQVLLLLFTVSSPYCSARTYFVDPNVVWVENFEGWGTSLAWSAEILGGYDEELIKLITEAFFSPDQLNLNIVRYVIGGTTPGIATCGPYRPGAKTESFKDGPDRPYNWTRDAGQRRILAEAKRLGVDTFEAFSNSPPDWMTISKCSNGNPLGGLLHNNLDSSNASLFAEYATDVIKHFHDTLGITFTTFAPFNEPYGLTGIGGWMSTPVTTQEGCNLRRDVMVEIIKSVNASLTAKGMDYVMISAADETQINTETATQDYFRDHGVNNLIEKVNVHGYWDHAEASNRRDLLRRSALIDGHRLWMDEMGWGESPLDDMSQGLEIVNRILKDFKKMLPSAWVYWQVMESIGEWGLIGVPYANGTLDDVEYHSGFYSMMQFSKYILKEYSLVHVNNENAVAAYHSLSSSLVIVLVNSEENMAGSLFDLTLFKDIGTTIAATRTSATEQNAGIEAPLLSEATFRYDAPPKSITTFVIRGVTINSKENLLTNGDFENSTDTSSWKIEGVVGSGTSDTHSWNGNSSGYFESSLDEVTLSQTIRATLHSNYYLSAWCYSEWSNTKLGAQINGVKEKEVSIQSGIGYQSYGIQFEARAGDNITIYYKSSLSTGKTQSYIDDVVLHFSHELAEHSSSGKVVYNLAAIVSLFVLNLFRLNF